MNSFCLKATLWPLCLFVFFVVGCEKDALRRNEDFRIQETTTESSKKTISLQAAQAYFNANRPAPNAVASGQGVYVNLEPDWDAARMDSTLSGRDVLTVPLDDQALRNLNGGRAGAILMFSSANQDTISADLLVYFADSAYYAQNNGVVQFNNFSGYYLFLDLNQQFEFGIAVRNGVPIGPVTELQGEVVNVVDDREGGIDFDDCIEREAYVWVPCNDMAVEECNFYITLTYYECNPSPGGNGGGYGNGNTTGGGGGGGGILLTEQEKSQWNFIKYLIETGQLNCYGAYFLGVPVHIFVFYGGQLPPGMDVQEYIQLMQLHELCQFTQAQFDWVLEHAGLVPYMTTLLAQHGNDPAWIDALKDVIDARIGGTHLFSWANMAKLVELQVKLELSEAELRWLISEPEPNLIEKINTFLTSIGMSDHHKEFSRFAISKILNNPDFKWDRFQELFLLVEPNLNKLIDDCDPHIDYWNQLANFTLSGTPLERIQNSNGNWDVQNIQDASGKRINLDEFSVRITELPILNGTQMGVHDLMELVRLSINSFVTGSTFKPTSVFDSELWGSNNPLTTIINIDMGRADGDVICSQYEDCCWIFTTLRAPSFSGSGIHPVSGNRQFGIRTVTGGYEFYTKGVDRTTKWWHSIFESVAFEEADALWNSFQESIATFVNENNGLAPSTASLTYRPDWEAIKSQLMSNTPITNVPCQQ